MSGTKQGIYHFGEFHLEAGARLLARKGQRVPLGSKAFEVLLCLVQHSGEVVSKDVLLKTVWPNSFVEDNNLSQHIFSLRKALADRADYIVTVPGRGYQFTGRVLEITPAVPRPQVIEILSEPVVERAVLAEPPAPVAVVAEVAPAGVAVMPPEERGSGGARRWAMWSVAAAVAAALLGWGGWMRPRAAKRVEHTAVVLAEFNNATGDATFDRTLKRALEIELEQSPNLDVVSEREAMVALEGMGRRNDEAITPEMARTICEGGKGQVVVAGSIASVGGEYLVTVQATDCKTGKELASAKAEAVSKEKVLGALDKVADRVGSALGDAGAARAEERGR